MRLKFYMFCYNVKFVELDVAGTIPVVSVVELGNQNQSILWQFLIRSVDQRDIGLNKTSNLGVKSCFTEKKSALRP